MRKSRGKWAILIVLLILLTGAWFLDGAHTPPPGGHTAPQLGKETLPPGPMTFRQPQSADRQPLSADAESFQVTLSVTCHLLLDQMDLLEADKHELVPEDGVIFAETAVTAYAGESVFQVMQRELKRAGIHLAFRNSPLYSSSYIEAIHNLYEFEAGELSGWLYRVNGWIPNYSCSRYTLQPGDVIEWIYSCDSGRDVDDSWEGGLQEIDMER